MGHTTNTPSAAGERASAAALRSRPHARVLIVGGGINGVGTFRDLALQGVDVALVERGDFCQGASGDRRHSTPDAISRCACERVAAWPASTKNTSARIASLQEISVD